MKILILSQVYWPDNSSVSQHLTDLAEDLVKRNHQILVISSQYPYEDSQERYKKREEKNDVTINRIKQTKFKKKYIWGRLINFLTYHLNLVIETIRIDKQNIDHIIVVSVQEKLKFLKMLLNNVNVEMCLALVVKYLII